MRVGSQWVVVPSCDDSPRETEYLKRVQSETIPGLGSWVLTKFGVGLPFVAEIIRMVDSRRNEI